MVTQPEPAPQPLPPPSPSGNPPVTPPTEVDPAVARRQKMIITALIAGGIIFILLIILIIIFLLQPGVPTEAIKNVFIIFLAVEMFIVGIAVVILTVQVATLINLLQNEVRPMLQSTNETINNLRGTTEFLSENLVEPVMQLNEYLASLKRVLELMGLKQK
jgi:membrane protein implicated in regulation of membrane protease activity